jgi:hypothetical protein
VREFAQEFGTPWLPNSSSNWLAAVPVWALARYSAPLANQLKHNAMLLADRQSGFAAGILTAKSRATERRMTNARQRR